MFFLHFSGVQLSIILQSLVQILLFFWARLWYPATATKDTGQGGHKPRTSVVLGALARSLVFFTAVRLKAP